MKVLTFGEIMLRLKAPGQERFFQTPMLEAPFGGVKFIPTGGVNAQNLADFLK